MTIQLLDGLTKREAERAVNQICIEEAKLRNFGGTGNFENVRFVESFRRGFSVDSREDVVRYRILADKIQ